MWSIRYWEIKDSKKTGNTGYETGDDTISRLFFAGAGPKPELSRRHPPGSLAIMHMIIKKFYAAFRIFS
jgi:hypothetical protein